MALETVCDEQFAAIHDYWDVDVLGYDKWNFLMSFFGGKSIWDIDSCMNCGPELHLNEIDGQRRIDVADIAKEINKIDQKFYLGR